MTEREQELAHTAGLLHDIGHFALSDRVAERGRTLTDEDWMAIQRHPELGADMLKDLGMYGPVAEIVLAHHERDRRTRVPERPDRRRDPRDRQDHLGRRGLRHADRERHLPHADELVRGADASCGASPDSQLDARYVEVLAGLLSGEGVEYRHADTADFDAELEHGAAHHGGRHRLATGNRRASDAKGSGARVCDQALAVRPTDPRRAASVTRNCSICSALKRR